MRATVEVHSAREAPVPPQGASQTSVSERGADDSPVDGSKGVLLARVRLFYATRRFGVKPRDFRRAGLDMDYASCNTTQRVITPKRRGRRPAKGTGPCRSARTPSPA